MPENDSINFDRFPKILKAVSSKITICFKRSRLNQQARQGTPGSLEIWSPVLF